MNLEEIADALAAGLKEQFGKNELTRTNMQSRLGQQNPVSLELNEIRGETDGVALQIQTVLDTLVSDRRHISNGMIHNQTSERVEQLLGVHEGQTAVAAHQKLTAKQREARREIARIFLRYRKDAATLTMLISEPPPVG